MGIKERKERERDQWDYEGEEGRKKKKEWGYFWFEQNVFDSFFFQAMPGLEGGPHIM